MMDTQTETQSQDTTLAEQIEGVDWGVDYGSVKVQLRAGRPTLITIERCYYAKILDR